MSLKDRLTRLTGEIPKAASVDNKQERIDELRRRLDRALERRERNLSHRAPSARLRAVPLEEIIIGEETQTGHGSFFVSRKTEKAGAVHGAIRICDAACTNMEAAAFLTGIRAAAGMSIDDGLFLDTETTGLMGGTGTFPFLIGLGWFEGTSFVTCQLFARDFSEEPAMLAYLSELASNKRFLVTFNGKAFDMNLLSARFILNRCKDTLCDLPHIDLLHPSRRILGHRLENARLSTIEARVLGVEREGDVPGAEIPQRYFDWLRRRDGRLLEDVFLHNRLDIVSMASLLKYLVDLVDSGHDNGRGHHGDLLKLAALILDRGNPERAETMFEALVASHDTSVARNARQSLSLLYKKGRRWEEAAAVWLDLVESDPYDIFAVQELAKFYEHRTREYEKAFQLVSALLAASHLGGVDRASIERRHTRLSSKLCGRQDGHRG